jgi:hypothetical protein
MKKMLSLLLIFTLITSCANPSMEKGFESLNASLNELQTAVDDLGVPEMIEELNGLNLIVGELIVDVEEYASQMEAYNLKVQEIKERLEAMLITVVGITEVVDGMTVTSGGLATSQQMQDLLSQVEEFQAGVDILVAIADYDYDGVQNALDKCPDTPIEEINNVDADGCSPSQLED